MHELGDRSAPGHCLNDTERLRLHVRPAALGGAVVGQAWATTVRVNLRSIDFSQRTEVAAVVEAVAP
jgi:hypothetical protein